LPWFPGRFEQPDRLAAGVFGILELSGTPGQEVSQAKLDRGTPGVISRAGHLPVDGPQRPDGRLGARLGPVVDYPLRLPVHRIQYIQPAAVGGRQDIDEFGEQIEGLAKGLALFGLTHRIEQDPDRFVVPRRGRTGEMQRGFGEPAGLKRRPGGLTMQGPSARSADLLVDHVPDERVLDLIDKLVSPLSLGNRPPGDQGSQDRIEPLSGQPGQRGEFCQR